MNNEVKEEIKELEILKIDHDDMIDRLLKKYPYEDGYNVEVISSKSIDARTEKIKIKISNNKINQKNKTK